ncbi:TRPM8 channel-associated factor 2 [Varanus komodoensis]|nr:TRPM8 channel-associated factor 2 [Varanus komodoensis]
MHAGYPIMADVRALQEITDVQAFFAKGTWGPIHELGHNQQREAWDFWPHTSEATCNLWSVYANETVLNIPRHKAHPDLKPHLRQKRIQDYIRNGAQLKDFEVFTALEPYLQLQEAFGWEPYIRIFAKYQTKTDIPPDNKSKMNLWAEMFSQQVQKNLGPFFKAWGWPIKVEISHKLATSYPPWAEDPMSQYRSMMLFPLSYNHPYCIIICDKMFTYPIISLYSSLIILRSFFLFYKIYIYILLNPLCTILSFLFRDGATGSLSQMYGVQFYDVPSGPARPVPPVWGKATGRIDVAIVWLSPSRPEERENRLRKLLWDQAAMQSDQLAARSTSTSTASTCRPRGSYFGCAAAKPCFFLGHSALTPFRGRHISHGRTACFLSQKTTD